MFDKPNWKKTKPGFRGTHRDAAMLPRQTERLVPEAKCAMNEDLDPNPCEEDEKFFKARPNAEEMEAAISKFLDAMPALETDGFQHLHRQLAWLPLPNQKEVSSMRHDEAVDDGLLKTMSEEELKLKKAIDTCCTGLILIQRKLIRIYITE